MRYCTNCGHRLGVGRYCTNCGARIAPPAADLPPVPTSARYPLFADTVRTEVAPPPPPPVAPQPTSPPSYAPPSFAPSRHRSFLPWLLGLLVLAVIATVGIVLLMTGSPDAADSGPTGDTRREQTAGGPEGDAERVEPADVGVPHTAPPSVDADGDPVSFDAANMLDDDPRTCWRMSDDGAGSSITFTFDEAVTITEVGLVNGYAKTDPPNDWYAGNRRVTAVVWVFDDGTEVPQELVEDRDIQTLQIDPIETTTVVLRLLEVSDPGTGPDGRNFTAISEVAFAGPA